MRFDVLKYGPAHADHLQKAGCVQDFEHKYPVYFVRNTQVQEQARERRRSDRKEKRELDKEKTFRVALLFPSRTN